MAAWVSHWLNGWSAGGGTGATVTPAVTALLTALPNSDRSIGAGVSPSIWSALIAGPRALVNVTAGPLVFTNPIGAPQAVPGSAAVVSGTVFGNPIALPLTGLSASSTKTGVVLATISALPNGSRNTGAGPSLFATLVASPQATTVTAGGVAAFVIPLVIGAPVSSRLLSTSVVATVWNNPAALNRALLHSGSGPSAFGNPTSLPQVAVSLASTKAGVLIQTVAALPAAIPGAVTQVPGFVIPTLIGAPAALVLRGATQTGSTISLTALLPGGQVSGGALRTPAHYFAPLALPQAVVYTSSSAQVASTQAALIISVLSSAQGVGVTKGAAVFGSLIGLPPSYIAALAAIKAFLLIGDRHNFIEVLQNRSSEVAGEAVPFTVPIQQALSTGPVLSTGGPGKPVLGIGDRHISTEVIQNRSGSLV